MSPLFRGQINVGRNIKELMKDNKKKGKARGANGIPRSRAQIVAIAMSVARKGKMNHTHHSHKPHKI